MATRPKTRTMGEGHKAALAQGREQGRAIRNYLDALEAHKPRRGRRRSVESLEQRLSYIDAALDQDNLDALQRVQLVQERINLVDQLEARNNTSDLAELEEEFIAVAAAYSERKGLTYTAWRSIGVDPRVLREAGLSR